jgi:hypothetical protein
MLLSCSNGEQIVSHEGVTDTEHPGGALRRWSLMGGLRVVTQEPAGGELPLPARNAEFATSVERFLGLEHVRSHCFAASILRL